MVQKEVFGAGSNSLRLVSLHKERRMGRQTREKAMGWSSDAATGQGMPKKAPHHPQLGTGPDRTPLHSLQGNRPADTLTADFWRLKQAINSCFKPPRLWCCVAAALQKGIWGVTIFTGVCVGGGAGRGARTAVQPWSFFLPAPVGSIHYLACGVKTFRPPA